MLITLTVRVIVTIPVILLVVGDRLIEMLFSVSIGTEMRDTKTI